MCSNSPYLIKVITKEVKVYNPDYGDERTCKCGHSYYRHFDSYDDWDAIGCEYCDCYEFEEA